MCEVLILISKTTKKNEHTNKDLSFYDSSGSVVFVDEDLAVFCFISMINISVFLGS
jgi:hypothetical protein